MRSKWDDIPSSEHKGRETQSRTQSVQGQGTLVREGVGKAGEA